MSTPSASQSLESKWLVLVHQIPPSPAYLRVKVGRHLQRVGAVAIKNSVYALPYGEEAQEDFRWVLAEVSKGGGDGTVFGAHLVGGMSDEQLTRLFQAARELDYREVAERVRALSKGLPRRGAPPPSLRAEVVAQLARLRRRLEEIVAIDFFGAPGRELVEGALGGLEGRLGSGSLESAGASAPVTHRREEHQGRTWVTRVGIKADRMASAWLIRRFIDPQARFKFVPAKGYIPEAGELRFDMFDAEFTHEGEACTFEVLLSRFGLADAPLRHLAEVVHDIDLKDSKFGREEAPGVARLVQGIAVARASDDERLERGSALFDDLYAGCAPPQEGAEMGETPHARSPRAETRTRP